MSSRGFFWLLLFLAFSSHAASKRLLIIGQGPDGHPRTTHEYMACTQILTELMKSYKSIETKVVKVDDAWPEGPKLLEEADGVVLFVSQGADWMHATPERASAFQRLIDNGKGLVALHWSVGAKDEKNVAAQAALLGGSRGGPQRKWKILSTTLRPVDPAHPILYGLKEFKVHDEMYYALTLSPTMKPLLTAEIDGKAETVCWALEHPSKARAFGFVGIHFHANWQLEEYRRLVVQGVLWTLRESVPKEGVKVDIEKRVLELDGLLPPLPQ